MRDRAKATVEKAEQKLKNAHEIASKIEEDAQRRAKDIAGSAWEAKENAEQNDQYTGDFYPKIRMNE